MSSPPPGKRPSDPEPARYVPPSEPASPAGWGPSSSDGLGVPAGPNFGAHTHGHTAAPNPSYPPAPGNIPAPPAAPADIPSGALPPAPTSMDPHQSGSPFNAQDWQQAPGAEHTHSSSGWPPAPAPARRRGRLGWVIGGAVAGVLTVGLLLVFLFPGVLPGVTGGTPQSTWTPSSTAIPTPPNPASTNFPLTLPRERFKLGSKVTLRNEHQVPLYDLTLEEVDTKQYPKVPLPQGHKTIAVKVTYTILDEPSAMNRLQSLAAVFASGTVYEPVRGELPDKTMLSIWSTTKRSPGKGEAGWIVYHVPEGEELIQFFHWGQVWSVK